METLRPLGFGELFDRAITLYVRHFFTFAAIAALEVIPAAMMVYGGDLEKPKGIAWIAHVFRHEAMVIHPIPAFAATLQGIGIVLLLIVAPFVHAAVGRGATLALRGATIDAPSLIAAAARRPSVLAVFAIYLGCIAVLYLAYHFVQFPVIYAAYRLAGWMTARAIMYGLFAGVLAVIVLAVPIMLFAIFAIVIEDAGLFSAIGTSWARLMPAKTFWRAIVVWASAVIAALVARLITLVVGIVAVAFGPLWAGALIESAGAVIAVPLVVAIMAVFYMDVRVRREGLDILQRMSSNVAVEHA